MKRERGCRLTIIYNGQRSIIECISLDVAHKMAKHWFRLNGHKSARGVSVKFMAIPKKGKSK